MHSPDVALGLWPGSCHRWGCRQTPLPAVHLHADDLTDRVGVLSCNTFASACKLSEHASLLVWRATGKIASPQIIPQTHCMQKD